MSSNAFDGLELILEDLQRIRPLPPILPLVREYHHMAAGGQSFHTLQLHHMAVLARQNGTI